MTDFIRFSWYQMQGNSDFYEQTSAQIFCTKIRNHKKAKRIDSLGAFMSLFDPIKKLVSTRSCLPNGPPAKCDSQYTSSNLIHNPFLLTSFLLFRAFGGIQKRRINSDPHFSPQLKARRGFPHLDP